MVCKTAWSFSLCDKWYYVDCLLISHYSLPLLELAIQAISRKCSPIANKVANICGLSIYCFF